MQPQGRIILGPDGLWRCWWCGTAPDYVAYHDNEWGVPVTDDIRLFEKICLEGFQAGLSWLTILRRREALRRAFAGFDYHVLSGWSERDVERHSQPARHHPPPRQDRIRAEQRPPRVRAGFRSWLLGRFLWSFAGRPPAELARELKRRGWTFVGPTMVESLMQAAGMVDAHEPGCWRRGACAALFRGPD